MAGAAEQGARRAGIVVTGSEVLGGRTLDRNSGFLVQRLEQVGVRTDFTVVVGDDRAPMRRALEFLIAEGVDLICTSGGLGPTHDDITVEVVAETLGLPLTVDESMREHIVGIVRRFASRLAISAEAMEAGAAKQATLPQGGTPLAPVGTAPGVLVRGPAGGPLVCVLPGPPRELQPMWEAATGTAPLADLLSGGVAYGTRSLRFFGVPESMVARHFDEVSGVVRDEGHDPGAVDVTICARFAEVEVFLRYPPEAAAAADRWTALLAEREPRALFTVHGQSVDQVIGQELVGAGETVAAAESCTTGLIAARLTEHGGSSAFFRGGVVAYDDDVKTALLGVAEETLARVGAVSEEVAIAMAQGVREAVGADWGVSSTGVAGPDGGTAEKPVGLVHVAVAGPGGIVREAHRRFPGDRESVRDRAAAAALHLLREELQGRAGRRAA
jgi:nicotinamide-nucleotide amidase